MSAIRENIFENFGTKAERVNVKEGVARGVKICGFVSKNGRYYKPSALKSAAGIYEGVKVYLDHVNPKASVMGRKIGEKFGTLRNVRFVESAGLFGDLHFNPHHEYAKTFAWDANNDAESFGLSHHADTVTARGRDRQGRTIIEQIIKVKSVDIVSDPATTQSLFESDAMDDDKTKSPMKMMLEAMSTKIAEMAESEGDDDSMLQALAAMLRKNDRLMEAVIPKDMNNAPKTKDEIASESVVVSELKTELSGLRTLIESMKADTSAQSLKTTIESELDAAGLNADDPKHVSEVFAGQLLATESVDVRAAMIADRVSLVGAKRSTLPKKATSTAASTVTESAEAPNDAASFVKSLR